MADLRGSNRSLKEMMVKIRAMIEVKEVEWRKIPSYQKFADKLTHEQGCELNAILWDFWQMIIGSINNK